MNDISSLISDGTHKTPKYVEKGIPFVSVKDISSGELKMDAVKYITKEEHLQLISRCKPEKGDILICRIGTLGKAIKINTDIEFSIFVSLGLIKMINCNLSDYIILMINSGYGQKWIDENKVGGGTHTYKINLVDLRKMLVPIPPQNEQKKIIIEYNKFLPYISKYDCLVTKLNNINNIIDDSLKKSILQYAIQGKLVQQDPNDEPASELLKRIRAEKEQLIKEGKNKRNKKDSYIYRGSDNSYYRKFIYKKIIC